MNELLQNMKKVVDNLVLSDFKHGLQQIYIQMMEFNLIACNWKNMIFSKYNSHLSKDRLNLYIKGVMRSSSNKFFLDLRNNDSD